MIDRNVEFPNRFQLQKVQGTDDIYDIIPAPGDVIAPGDLFSKGNMLPDEIVSLLGLKMENPQVKDALNVLANVGNLHVWERVQDGVTYYLTSTDRDAYPDNVTDAQDAYYTLGDAVIGEFYLGRGQASTPTGYHFASAISVDSDGTVSLSYFTGGYIGSGNVINTLEDAKGHFLGKYVMRFTDGDSIYDSNRDKLPINEIVYIPEDASITTKEDSYSNKNFVVDEYQPVTGHAAIPANTTITYLGQLGEPGAKIEVGSYVGTGTYGSSNPNSLTFGFAPKIVKLLFRTSTNVGGDYLKNEDLTGNGIYKTQEFMVADRLTAEYAQGEGFGYNSYSSYGKKSPDGKTFYWYSNNVSNQCNSSEYVYYYIAIR